MQDNDFLTWEELQKAYKRAVWLVLRFMTMKRDPKEDLRQEQKKMFESLKLDEERKKKEKEEIEKKLVDDVKQK